MTGLDLGFCQNGDSASLPGSYAPGIPGAALLALPTAHFHGEPVTRAGNPGFARGSKPVAELFTAARAVEWLIRLSVVIRGRCAGRWAVKEQRPDLYLQVSSVS